MEHLRLPPVRAESWGTQVLSPSSAVVLVPEGHKVCREVTV